MSTDDTNRAVAPEAARAGSTTAVLPEASPDAPSAAHPAHAPTKHSRAWWIIRVSLVVVIVVGIIFAIPWVIHALNTVSTDDAYVNGHVTFVAPRVPGQVINVFVDDNNRVHKGDLLLQLDKEPYQVQLNIAQAAVSAAQSDLVNAQSQARGVVGQTRSLRFALEHAIEDVDNQAALLKAKVATLASKRATLAKATADYERAAPLVKGGAVAQETLDTRKEAQLVAQAQVDEALQGVYQVRVSLGLPPQPAEGQDLASVPPDLDQTFSSVRQAQASLIQSAALLGVADSFNKSPRQLVADFYKRDPSGDIDVIYAQILKDAPAVKQAEAKLAQAKRNLEQAVLNLRYCDVVAEIDGVVTRRQVNPGNNVVAGQSAMAIRSVTDIWIDANFKETQLGKIRIGQPVDIDVDMYGSRQRFKGRVSGFTMGTGSTLALLPAENATGNFVKVVQRLPVRIDLIDYNPETVPLFIGLSVTPSILINEKPEGPSAGQVLQPYLAAAAANASATTQPSSPETRP